jgi:hypothetical protein
MQRVVDWCMAPARTQCWFILASVVAIVAQWCKAGRTTSRDIIARRRALPGA